jgi:hypothetical protein
MKYGDVVPVLVPYVGTANCQAASGPQAVRSAAEKRTMVEPRVPHRECFGAGTWSNPPLGGV